MDRKEAIGMLYLQAMDQIKKMEAFDLSEINLTEKELKEHEQYLGLYIEATSIIGLEVEGKWHRVVEEYLRRLND